MLQSFTDNIIPAYLPFDIAGMWRRFGSVLNGQGQLPRTLDRTERQNAVSSLPRNLRTAIVAKDSGACNVRQIGRVRFFASFNNFMCQTEMGVCLKGNSGGVSNHWREWTLIG